MKTFLCESRGWSPALALLGLAALLSYILACTSFSPDDSKVLFSMVEPESAGVGVAVYDRQAKKTELLFVPYGQDLSRSTDREAPVLRPQWLPDGRSFFVAWLGSSQPALNIALLPYGRTGAFRIFELEGLDDPGSQLVQPLPVSDTFLFLKGKSNSIVRLNLFTGQLEQGNLPPNTDQLLSPGNGLVCYMTKPDGQDESAEFGLIDPISFTSSTLGRATINLAGSCPVIDSSRRFLAYAVKQDNQLGFRLVEPGKPDRILPLRSVGDNLKLGNARFSPKGDLLYAAFLELGTTGTNASLGFLEVPLDDRKPRKNVLLQNVSTQEEDDVFLFPIEISHDGKALAVSSTYLALKRSIKLEDRALFLVDLTDPNRSVTRVSGSLPRQ